MQLIPRLPSLLLIIGAAGVALNAQQTSPQPAKVRLHPFSLLLPHTPICSLLDTDE